MSDSLMSKKSDEELVRLSRENVDGAIDELATRFFGIVRSGVGYIESDDIAQESLFGFLNAVKSFDEARGVSFKTYALTCMRNKAFDAVKSVKDEIPLSPDSELLTAGKALGDPLDSIIISEQLASVLGACEVTLSAFEKSVVFCQASGMTYKKIADRLGVSEKAVNNALQRARKKLKSVFD